MYILILAVWVILMDELTQVTTVAADSVNSIISLNDLKSIQANIQQNATIRTYDANRPGSSHIIHRYDNFKNIKIL